MVCKMFLISLFVSVGKVYSGFLFGILIKVFPDESKSIYRHAYHVTLELEKTPNVFKIY